MQLASRTQGLEKALLGNAEGQLATCKHPLNNMFTISQPCSKMHRWDDY